jgi:hypothetical protein
MIFQLNINIITIELISRNYTLLSQHQTIACATKTDIDMTDYPSKKTMARQIAALLPVFLLGMLVSACNGSDSEAKSFSGANAALEDYEACALYPNRRHFQTLSLYLPSWNGKLLMIR